MIPPGQYISHSQLTNLLTCEQQFAHRYIDEIEQPTSSRAELGKALHICVQAYHDTGEWDVPLDCDEDIHNQVRWLMPRYARMYPYDPDGTRVLGTEVELSATIPGTSIQVYGILDNIWKTGSQTWVVDHKSTGNKQRLQYHHFWLQAALYYWLAHEHGYNVSGVIRNAIYTYQWKTGKHFDHETCYRTWYSFDDDEIDYMLNQVKMAYVRRQELINKERTPLRSPGVNCNTCAYKAICWEGGVVEVEIV